MRQQLAPIVEVLAAASESSEPEIKKRHEGFWIAAMSAAQVAHDEYRRSFSRAFAEIGSAGVDIARVETTYQTLQDARRLTTATRDALCGSILRWRDRPVGIQLDETEQRFAITLYAFLHPLLLADGSRPGTLAYRVRFDEDTVNTLMTVFKSPWQASREKSYLSTNTVEDVKREIETIIVQHLNAWSAAHSAFRSVEYVYRNGPVPSFQSRPPSSGSGSPPANK